MSLPPPPPGPPQGPPPGWGPRPGAGTPPPDTPTQVPGGWGATPPPPPGPPAPPQGPGGWGGPDPKGGGGRRTGLIVGIVALVVLLVGGIVGGAVFALRGGDDETTTTTTEVETSTDGTDSTDNTDDASSDGSAGTGSPGEQESDFTPYAPTDDAGDDVTLDVKKSDFPGDWNFRLGEKKFDATAAGAWDYKTCAEVEAGAKLTSQRCKYAVQLTYNAFGGKVRLTQLFLVFDTEPRAKSIEGSIAQKDLDLRPGSFFEPRAMGLWVRSSYGNVVVITIGTSKVKVSEDRLDDITSTMNSDFSSALVFMGM